LIPREIIDQVLDASSLVDYIGRDIVLQKNGSIYKGLCPFHNEKTPSFVVYPSQNRYYCFGCRKNGDLFSYLQEKKGLDFIEAVKKVASENGIIIPDDSPAAKIQNETNREIIIANEHALKKFRYNLKVDPDGKKASNYLQARGLTLEMIDIFKIGYAKANWQVVTDSLISDNIDIKTMVRCGISRYSEKSKRYYDYFRDRVIFPIFNTRDDVVAFGGRIIEDDNPKYLNSPDSPVFHKGKILYGLSNNRNNIRKNNVAYIVEGYLDVVGLYMAGFKVAVAPLGTSLTEDHLKILKKYTSRLVFLFDGDIAGKNAVVKSAGIVQKLGFSAKVVILDKGQDPFDLAIQKNKNEIIQVIKKSISLDDFVIKELQESVDNTNPNRTLIFLRKIYNFVQNSNEKVYQTNVIKKASLLIGIDADDALADFTNYRQNNRIGVVNKSVIEKNIKTEVETGAGDLAFFILRLIGLHPQLWEKFKKEAVAGINIRDSKAIYLYAIIDRLFLQKGISWTSDDFLNIIEDKAIYSVVLKDIKTDRFKENWQELFNEILSKFGLIKIKTERKVLMDEFERLRFEGESTALDKIKKKIVTLKREEESIRRKYE